MLQHRILCCLQLLLAFQLFTFLVLQFLCDLIVLPCQLLILLNRFPAFIQQPLQRGKASPDLFDLSLRVCLHASNCLLMLVPLQHFLLLLQRAFCFHKFLLLLLQPLSDRFDLPLSTPDPLLIFTYFFFPAFLALCSFFPLPSDHLQSPVNAFQIQIQKPVPLGLRETFLTFQLLKTLLFLLTVLLCLLHFGRLFILLPLQLIHFPLFL